MDFLLETTGHGTCYPKAYAFLSRYTMNPTGFTTRQHFRSFPEQVIVANDVCYLTGFFAIKFDARMPTTSVDAYVTAMKINKFTGDSLVGTLILFM